MKIIKTAGVPQSGCLSEHYQLKTLKVFNYGGARVSECEFFNDEDIVKAIIDQTKKNRLCQIFDSYDK